MSFNKKQMQKHDTVSAAQAHGVLLRDRLPSRLLALHAYVNKITHFC